MVKRIINLTVLTIMFSLLVGCAGGNASPAPAPPPTSDSAPASDSESSEATVTSDATQISGTIEVWTWFPDYLNASIEDFNAMYPNVTVNVTPMGWGDYLPKFETARATGSELPDVVFAESYWWGQFLSYEDIFVDLSTLGFNKDDLVSSIGNAVVGPSGKFIAIPQGLGIGCIWYRKDLAKEYFGTDDAAELEKMFSTWEDFIDAGEIVKTKSDGNSFLLADSTSIIEALIGSYKTNGKNYVNSTSLTLNNMEEPFNLLEKALNSGYIAKFDGPALDAAWAGGEVVFFPSAAWREGFIMNQDPDGSGRWGIMMPPNGSYFRGGTAELIIDNGPERVELASLFINHRLTTDSGMKVNIANGNITAIKEIQAKKMSNGVNSVLWCRPNVVVLRLDA